MKRFLSNRSGQTALEYSLIAVVVMVAILSATQSMGQSAKGMFESLVTAWEGAES